MLGNASHGRFDDEEGSEGMDEKIGFHGGKWSFHGGHGGFTMRMEVL